jgi:hypothetical protein
MSSAKKYKHYKTETDEKELYKSHENKKAIHTLKVKIATELSDNIEKQKKAALILERLINSK